MPTIVVNQEAPNSQRLLSKMASFHGSNILDKISHKSELRSIQGSNFEIDMEPKQSNIHRYEMVANLGKVAVPSAAITQKQTLSRKNRYNTVMMGNLTINQAQMQAENLRNEGSASVASNLQRINLQLEDSRHSKVDSQTKSPQNVQLQRQYSQRVVLNQLVDYSRSPILGVLNQPGRVLLRACST